MYGSKSKLGICKKCKSKIRVIEIKNVNYKWCDKCKEFKQ